ncbi:MAG TPA: TMEM175 family protein [Gemmatimonadaceae bacterium]|jgi:uncharacterized membrane protein|nr:TMEM175 family protein [Gemmatimonadaceae bacterium]
MVPDRLNAFTDGVLAIIITIMVLELRAPHDAELASLRALLPVAMSYVLSFAYLIIYWHNHHHLLHHTRSVTVGVLWANAHLVFWLSLVPFVTAWMGENHFAPVPMAAYGVVLFLAAVAYWVLLRVIDAGQGPASSLAAAARGDRKARLSALVYAIAVPLAFVRTWVAGTLYAAVALMWIIPARRIEPIVVAENPPLNGASP